MRIELERRIDEAQWNRLVAADPDASFFHDPAWSASLAHAYPEFHPLYLLARDDAGRLIGGLPAITVSRVGLGQILSLPFGSYGTPLALPSASVEPALIRRALARRWFEEAARSGIVRAHFVPFSMQLPDPASGQAPEGWRVPERTHLIDLSEGFDTIWFHRYDKENRTVSRKAVRLGVVVAPAAGEGALAELDILYRPQSREWTGHTPYHYGLFAELLARAPERVRIWVARHEERPVFAVMAFYHKETVTPWVSGSAADARPLCAGNLIHKVLIEDACRRGFVVYNFGGSGGVPGIEAFKVAFGARPHEYASYFKENPIFGRVRLWRKKVVRMVRGEG